jgi:hypothetical protein
MTEKQFRIRAEHMFLRRHPSAVITGWITTPRRVVYPTGLRGLYGRFHAVADGYQPKVMIAEYDKETGFLVR